MSGIEFTPANLQGTYALSIIGEGGEAPFAAVGLLAFDGAGGVSGSIAENRRGDRYGARVVIDVPYRATCTLEASGLGVISAAGASDPEAYLTIREVAQHGVGMVADAIALVFRDLDASTGCLRLAEGFRRPDGAVFSNASLKGRYMGFAVGNGGRTPMAGFGVVTYDGEGGFSETNVANAASTTFAARQFVRGEDSGRYVVEPDGTGSVADGGLRFVITRVRMTEGVALAEEYRFVLRDLVPATGSLFTGIVRRVSD
jgi:hypothetical protein